jgi:arylsulfatase
VIFSFSLSYCLHLYTHAHTHTDEQIGRIMDTLKKKNLLENTFVFFTSDHGDGQGTHHHWRKGYPFEFSAHVPLVMRWPESYQDVNIPRGTAIRAPVVTELRDLFHTFVDIVGSNLTNSLNEILPSDHFDEHDGKSLLCLLRDSSGKESCNYKINPGPWREWIDMEHSTCYNESNHWNALTDGNEKYVFRAWYGDEQFFDIEKDPNELVEVSEQRREDVSKWRKRLVNQFESERRGTDWVSDDGALQRRLNGETYSPNYPKS